MALTRVLALLLEVAGGVAIVAGCALLALWLGLIVGGGLLVLLAQGIGAETGPMVQMEAE